MCACVGAAESHVCLFAPMRNMRVCVYTCVTNVCVYVHVRNVFLCVHMCNVCVCVDVCNVCAYVHVHVPAGCSRSSWRPSFSCWGTTRRCWGTWRRATWRSSSNCTHSDPRTPGGAGEPITNQRNNHKQRTNQRTNQQSQNWRTSQRGRGTSALFN